VHKGELIQISTHHGILDGSFFITAITYITLDSGNGHRICRRECRRNGGPPTIATATTTTTATTSSSATASATALDNIVDDVLLVVVVDGVLCMEKGLSSSDELLSTEMSDFVFLPRWMSTCSTYDYCC